MIIIKDYEIVKMSPEQARVAWLWAKEEEWNPGLEDHVLLPQVDPDGCFALTIPDPKDFKRKLMIGSITAVDYGGYGFLGMFIVHPSYRGKGYGKILSDHAMKKLRGLSNVGLDGVRERVPMYEKCGFKIAYDIPVYRFPAATRFSTRYAEDYDDSCFDEIADYDLKVFGVSRGQFLRAWINSKFADAAVVKGGNKILGYGVVRDCYDGRKIGPLFAENVDIAEDILGLLISKRKNSVHFLDLPRPTPDGDRLVKDAEVDFMCTRMYLGKSPQQDVKRVYGSTTFEMG